MASRWRRRIRQEPELSAGIDLLAALTGFAEEEARDRSEQAGFDHHLVKPVNPEAVLALLASLEWSGAEQAQPAGALASGSSSQLDPPYRA